MAAQRSASLSPTASQNAASTSAPDQRDAVVRAVRDRSADVGPVPDVVADRAGVAVRLDQAGIARRVDSTSARLGWRGGARAAASRPTASALSRSASPPVLLNRASRAR